MNIRGGFRHRKDPSKGNTLRKQRNFCNSRPARVGEGFVPSDVGRRVPDSFIVGDNNSRDGTDAAGASRGKNGVLITQRSS